MPSGDQSPGNRPAFLRLSPDNSEALLCLGANDQRLCFQGLKILNIIFSPDFLCVSHSVVSDFVTPWTVAYQAPLFMGFSRQEYWIGLLFPSPGDLPNPGIEPMSLTSPALAGEFFTTLTTQEAHPYQFLIFYLLYYSHSNCFIMLILFFIIMFILDFLLLNLFQCV